MFRRGNMDRAFGSMSSNVASDVLMLGVLMLDLSPNL